MAGGRPTRRAGMSAPGLTARPSPAPWVVIGVLLLLGGVISLFAVRGVRIVSLQRRLDVSLATKQELIAERSALEETYAQRDDLAVIEEEARRRLGWIMPGEVRVIFVPPRRSSSSERE